MDSLKSFESSIFNHDDYTLIGTDPINKGGFGRIYLVENKKTKERFAAKVIIPPPNAEQLSDEFISREVQILIQIHAPTIVNFYGFSFTDFQGHSNVTILMDYKTNGSLADHIKNEQQNACVSGYDNTSKQIILCGIAHGMMILHSNHVIHRDLKPDNILLDSNFYPYITDFGLSKFIDPTNSRIQSQAGCGTPFYMAPEVIIDIEYSQEADIYSFGILMYEVLSGHMAYREERKAFKPYVFNNKVLSGMRPTFDSSMKESLKALIERCWSKVPKDRPTFQELFNLLSLSASKDKSAGIENLDYCLSDVDVQKVHDYVNLITPKESHVEQNQPSNEDEELKPQNEKEQPMTEHGSESKETTPELNPLIGLSFERMRQKINKEHLKEITIPSSINRIESGAFEGCNSLTKVTIPSSVTVIGPAAFRKCGYLTEIIIPSSVALIGKEAFLDCCRLAQVTIPSSLVSIGKQTFEYCTSLTHITIPSSVKTIGVAAFSLCYNLEQIIIPSSVESIHKYAFSKSLKLKEITIPASVTLIEKMVFARCSKLENIIVDPNNPKYISIEGVLFTKNMQQLLCYPCCKAGDNYTIPSSVTSIQSGAFIECKSLKQITLPSLVTKIGKLTFSECSLLEQITIPSLVTKIGSEAFNACFKLSQITIPSSVASIGGKAFYRCGSLKQIAIPSSMTTIKNHTFCMCYSLTQITIPSSITSIESQAFYDCTSLTQIIIPSSVTSIPWEAFFNCKSLEQVTIPSSVTSIGEKAFCSCESLTQIKIPPSVTRMGYHPFTCCPKLQGIFVDPANPEFCSIDGVLIEKKTQTLIWYPNARPGSTNYTIPSSVKAIAKYSFYDCTSIEQITIPSSMTSIGKSAFSRFKSLAQVTIPSSVTSIEECAFSYCDSLTQIVIPSSVTSIGESAFSHCKLLTQITIPSSVTSIGKHAFYECPKLSLSIQDDLKKRYGSQII